MLSALIVGGIAVSVAIGYKTNYNTGFFAMVFAYLIGCFALGMSTKEIINGWPVGTMFVIFSVSLFYNFALVNGTLEKTARYLLYACRRFPGLLPFALYFASAGIAALGAGFFTVMAFMAPVTILICKEAKMDQLPASAPWYCLPVLSSGRRARRFPPFLPAEAWCLVPVLRKKSGMGCFPNCCFWPFRPA